MRTLRRIAYFIDPAIGPVSTLLIWIMFAAATKRWMLGDYEGAWVSACLLALVEMFCVVLLLLLGGAMLTLMLDRWRVSGVVIPRASKRDSHEQ